MLVGVEGGDPIMTTLEQKGDSDNTSHKNIIFRYLNFPKDIALDIIIGALLHP